MATTFTPSRDQAAFYDWMLNGSGSATVRAVAGSGKSTTILEGQMHIAQHQTVLLLSFNADITRTNKEKLAKLGEDHGRSFPRTTVRTFHSVGFSAVCKHMGWNPREVTTDGRKCLKMARNWLGPDVFEIYGSFIAKLVGLAKGEGIGALVPDTEDRWYALVNHHDLYLTSDDGNEAEAIALARELLQRSNQAAKSEGLIDYDDQLYLVCLWKLRLWQNDWVFIDESQDTNPVRRALAKLALKPGGRLVAVGDPRQGIYGFTGASHDAMDLIRREFNCKELNLGVSFRCSHAAVGAAKKWVDYIEAFEHAAQGEELTLSLTEALGKLTSHDAILCRNTAPLIGLAYKIIATGRGCTILGKDIATALVDLIGNMRAKGIVHLMEKLEAYRDREVAKFTAKGEEQKAESINDRVDCINIVINHLHENERTVPKLVSKLEGMFSDNNGVLTLSTVHKAKGKEWGNVAIYKPELMPSKWARQDHQMAQEENLQYVAVTRTKGGLYWVVGE